MDLEKLKRDLDARSRRGFWRPKPGKNRVRILPQPDPNKTFYEIVKLHWIGNRPVLCTGDDCVVCMIIQQGLADIRTHEQFLVNLIDLDDVEAGVQIWPMPVTPWADLCRLVLDDEWGDITDPETGRNVTIVRQGSGPTDTRYQVIPDPKQSKIDPAWLDQAMDLSRIYRVTPPQQLASILRDSGVLPGVTSVESLIPPTPEEEALRGPTTEEESPTPPPLKPPKKTVTRTTPPASYAAESESQPSQSKLDPAKVQAKLRSLLKGTE
ncbi:MAG: hypothetical protein DRN14_02515 [Thermoplasmata archaeon]|nr:MAG: hypothetical protein DRN14_02515 [Thermoplasmata archaeon]